MKCLCGYNEKPDNITKLRNHATKCVKTAYFIVWRDSEFTVTDEKKKNEQNYGTELPKGKKVVAIPKVGLPTYTPTESLLSPLKTRRNEFGEEDEKKKKKK